MITPLPESCDFPTCVANGLRESLAPFAEFGIRVNVAVFHVGDGGQLHALAHLDRLPIINRTVYVHDMSVASTTQAFLVDEAGKLAMLYEMIGANPYLMGHGRGSVPRPDLSLVE